LEDGSIWENTSVPPDYEGHSKNLMIFGYGNKFLSIDPFLSLIYEFREKLKQKDYIFAIGYSFFDPYINNIFFEALSQANGDKKLVIVNPWALDEYEALSGKNIDFGTEEFVPTEADLKNLSEKFKEMQQSQFLSDLPDFNVIQVAPNLIELVPLKTGKFFELYFADNGKKLFELINRMDNESKSQKEVFD